MPGVRLQMLIIREIHPRAFGVPHSTSRVLTYRVMGKRADEVVVEHTN
jgi:hypothetical protein